MIKNTYFYKIPAFLLITLFSTFIAQNTLAQAEPRMNRANQMMENSVSMMGKKQGMVIACEKLVSSLDKRLERLDKAGENRAQIIANIEKSIENRIEALKLQNKNTEPISSNFATFEQMFSEYYNERGLLITKLRSIKDKECNDGDLESKKAFVSEIKAFNVEYKTHLKEFKDLSSYLRQNVLEEIRKLRGNE